MTVDLNETRVAKHTQMIWTYIRERYRKVMVKKYTMIILGSRYEKESRPVIQNVVNENKRGKKKRGEKNGGTA